jgi:hypothetical protein
MVNPTGEVKGSAGERSEMSDRTRKILIPTAMCVVIREFMSYT